MYDHPANLFAVGFIGSPAMNLLTVPSQDGALKLAGEPVALREAASAQVAAGSGKTFTLGFRPKDVSLSPDGFPVTVTLVETLRRRVRACEGVGGGRTTPWCSGRTAGTRRPSGRPSVAIAGQHVHLFDPETGMRLVD